MPRTYRAWTTPEVKRLKALWATTRPYQYAETFPARTYRALTHMAGKLGLYKKYPKPEPRHCAKTSRKKVTDAHVFQTPYFDTPEFAQALRRQTDEAKQEQRGTASV